ncbi:peptidase family T4 [Anaerococcus prevotii ACS-065-V-Col13]|uniref:Peptidase family T4 n=1 Tax=Anaerococcus prevotii ACS-065-V-Col13 TaxID=879305 RepID=F0GTD2_9FIRM|nr:peptidase family T4 [Anaerococcus prevotii ACS-065-V-Col13]
MIYSGYLTDVCGIKLGHASDFEGGTGLSVIIPDSNNTAAVEVRGSAPGTRETDLLNPINQVSEVNGIILSGGSAYGLDAASGLMEELEKDNRGFDVGCGIVPIVSQAVLFDLAYKNPLARPNAKMAKLAYKNASYDNKECGIIGAGTGATVGKAMGMDKAFKSGLGQASMTLGDLTVSAIVAVNAFGDILDYEKGKQIAGPMVDGKMLSTMDNIENIAKSFSEVEGKNTTIGLVATNASFNKTELTKICQMTHDGYARSINPVHTMFDGDTIFALATNKVKANVTIVGALASMVMSRAIANAIYTTKEK